MKTLIVIPARLASTRFPAKPLAQIAGPDGLKTLIQRTWETGQAAATAMQAQERGQGMAHVVVATDDAGILAHVQGFGGKAVMTSPLARNGTERCAEVAERIQGYDIIVNLQGDAPLTPPWFITDLLAALSRDPAADMATPVLRCTGAMRAALLAERAAGRVGGTTAVFAADGRALYFSKEVIPHSTVHHADDALTPVYHHVGLYAYRPAALLAYPAWPISAPEAQEGLEQLRFLDQGRRVLCVDVDAKSRAFWEVNNPGDIPVVAAMLAQNAGLLNGGHMNKALP